MRDACPINDIKVLMPNESPLADYTERPLAQGIRIAFTTDSASLPISEVRLTESEVCLNHDEYELSKGRDFYPLDKASKCIYQISGTHNDPRYEVIGRI